MPRIIDSELSELVNEVPAVVLVGAKAVGKTESAKRIVNSQIDLTDPEQLEILAAGRREVLSAANPPILLDEWQFDPATWEAMRRIVDEDPRPGRFVLTGSANPRGVRVHSGAGRVVRLRMRPMSLVERGYLPSVSMVELWAGGAQIKGSTSMGLRNYAEEIVSSGFPAIRLGSQRARNRLLSSYLQSVLEREVPELGFTLRRPSSLAQWLRAYAAASSTTAQYSAIADAIGEADRPTRATANAYREVLSQLWLLDQVPAFTLSRNRLAELGKAPKHQLADPALVAAALRITPEALLNNSVTDYSQLRDGALFGKLFEALATLCVRVYSQPLELEVSHIRTARGEREIDLVVHSPDGKALGIEVKLSATPKDADVRHLHWLKKNMGADLIDQIVLTTGSTAYRRPDGIAVVPLGLLGP